MTNKKPFLAHIAREETLEPPAEGQYDDSLQVSFSAADDKILLLDTPDGRRGVQTRPGNRNHSTDGGDIPAR